MKLSRTLGVRVRSGARGLQAATGDLVTEEVKRLTLVISLAGFDVDLAVRFLDGAIHLVDGRRIAGGRRTVKVLDINFRNLGRGRVDLAVRFVFDVACGALEGVIAVVNGDIVPGDSHLSKGTDREPV
ncbi:hypothetical protein K469DRAFT_688359 [Zopfia rhizophila CBS 207.26]|uniref:Uncharacterized protein n=1 Tax=Zopfia rhizophila CBS 207.26 TaxID=1314779 RepID=A0A6A6D912_9PEZI|nr:hypothetical protein K469DRAFT_688956 [Zopfia rhizophila CBS 207.26]KAF2174493.1 hypothetical protein K469DRAFT_688359 [Zopfia rhizophila CBS 207.26]